MRQESLFSGTDDTVLTNEQKGILGEELSGPHASKKTDKIKTLIVVGRRKNREGLL